jgi:hypothetical protein
MKKGNCLVSGQSFGILDTGANKDIAIGKGLEDSNPSAPCTSSLSKEV